MRVAYAFSAAMVGLEMHCDFYFYPPQHAQLANLSSICA